MIWTTEYLFKAGYLEATGTLMPIDFTKDCPGGGSRHFHGEGVTDSTRVAFTGEFDACGFDGLLLSGEIEYLQVRTTTDGNNETSVMHTGNLTIDGEFDGDCELDRIQILGASLVRTGSVCGHAADALVDYLPPP